MPFLSRDGTSAVLEDDASLGWSREEGTGMRRIAGYGYGYTGKTRDQKYSADEQDILAQQINHPRQENTDGDMTNRDRHPQRRKTCINPSIDCIGFEKRAKKELASIASKLISLYLKPKLHASFREREREREPPTDRSFEVHELTNSAFR